MRCSSRLLVLTSIAATAALSEAQTLGGGGGPAGDASYVEKCDAPKGTLAVAEPQSHMVQSLHSAGLGSPTAMLRLVIQQSNCFQLVERGAGMRNLQQERQLAQSGQLQSGQNVGQGQMVAADFVLTPSVVFSNRNAGGVGAALGGLLGSRNSTLGAVAGGVRFQETQTALLLADTRSGIQVAAAEGSAQKTDFNLGGTAIGASAAGALGGYTNTAQGKIVAASLLDNWNKIVVAIRTQPSLVQPRGTAASQANAATSVRADAGSAGDVFVPKIAGVKVFRSASESDPLVTLARNDEVVFEGEERDGFMKVATPGGSGWVKAILMRRR
jgi:hypothetical protein